MLTYLCVDFGFFHKLFNLRPEDNAVYRAAGEAAMASSFVIFLTTFLRLALWHGLVRMMIGVWMVAQLTLIAVAVIDPRLAATFARLSFLAIGGVGGLFTLFLAVKGQDRALSLCRLGCLFLVWIFATGMTLSGPHVGRRRRGEPRRRPRARRHPDGLHGHAVRFPLARYRRTLARRTNCKCDRWRSRHRDRPFGNGTSAATRSRSVPKSRSRLSLMPGELSTKVEEFLKHVHPTDKERFRVTLMSAQERSGVRIKTDFRLRHADNSWRWFELEAASVPNSDGRTLRCVGLLRDVSDTKRAHERLLHDAVHCSLTGLPNRELFLDRLKAVMVRAKTDNTVKPAVIYIDLDKFKSANASLGLVRGDSLLLTVARRLQRHLGPHDTVARVGGDQFALLFCRRTRGPQSSSACRTRAPLAPRADTARKPGSRSDRFDGHRPLGRHAGRRRRPAERRQARDVPRQASGLGSNRGLRAWNAPRSPARILTSKPISHARSTRVSSGFSISRSSTFRRRNSRASKRSCVGSTPSSASSTRSRQSPTPATPSF